jgi:thiamine-phosphate pyrophosphorylase
MRGLYAVVDVDFLEHRGIPLEPFAARVISAVPAAVQLRAKRARPRDILTWLHSLRALTVARGVPLFANDRPDLAVLSRCDGVHVGQEDLHVRDVRRFAPSLRVGVSTHDLEQLRDALALRPDYVAFGPVFATRSKENPDPVVGLSGLARASELSRQAGIPLVAIGGIDIDRAREVGALADMGAVIAALVPEDGDLAGVTARAAELHEELIDGRP